MTPDGLVIGDAPTAYAQAIVWGIPTDAQVRLAGTVDPNVAERWQSGRFARRNDLFATTRDVRDDYRPMATLSSAATLSGSPMRRTSATARRPKA